MLRDEDTTGDFHSALVSSDPHYKPGPTTPCACCSPIFPAMNEMMAVTDTELARAAYWQARGRDLPPRPSGTQLFVNARILTMNPAKPTATAIAIRDGRIVDIGNALDLGEDVEVVDCEGRFLMPGFVEPHMHFLPIASLNRFEDVGPFRFDHVEEALARLKELARETPAGEWIMGRQFDPSLQEGAEVLTRDMLDDVSVNHPVFVYNASLHFAYCNSAALAAAGIDASTPDDPNSPYGRDIAGEPNGVLKGAKAIGSVIRHNPAMRQYDLAAGCLDVCRRANRLGITTFCDQATGMSRGTSEVELYRALADSGQMTVRLRYSPSYAIQDKWDAAGIECGDGDALVRAAAWKIVSDGSNQGFTGLQREPYLYRDDRGLPYVDPLPLIEMVKDRARRGWALAIHANGDQAIDNVLDAFEAAHEEGLLTNTPSRIEHCSILHDEQIERIRRLNLSPSFLIGHVHYWGRAMRDLVFGDRKASLLDRTAACEAAGIRWTLHSDEPVTEMGPLRCIQNAVTRRMWKEPETRLAPEECVSVDVALRAMTIDAAWQCHSDHEVGSLEVGKLADFVILGADPRDVPQDKIQDIEVLETWMDGRCVYCAAEEAGESSERAR